MPIPPASQDIQNRVENLVNRILAVKQQSLSADTTSLEQEIDNLFYHLYNLTYDEVLIIDPETPITQEDYTQELYF